MSVNEINDKIREAAKVAAQYHTDNVGAPAATRLEWPVAVSVNKGLEGAIACETKIGYVDGVNGRLVYRGHDSFELSEHSNFEETSYLLLYGKMPNAAEYKAFDEKLKGYRKLPHEIYDALKLGAVKTAHPMTSLYITTGMLGALDQKSEDVSWQNQEEIAIRLISRISTLVGEIARLRKGLEPVEPDLSLGHAANLVYMMTGSKPDEATTKLMDIALILHADHGMNASTFTAMVANSSLSDMYSSVVAGITSLKGSLHGGANEKVLYDLEEIGTPDKAEEWFKKAREEKRKVMGFGHRVYKAYDPRARIFGPLVEFMARRNPEINNLYSIAKKLDAIICEQFGKEKKIFPNVDFYSGLIYRGMGIETAMFTPIFAASRISGWTARILEYLKENRLFRPRAVYTGETKAEYIPIDKR